MTAAFEQRLDAIPPGRADAIWPKFADLICDEEYTPVGHGWPWFDGTHVWVMDRAIMIRFLVADRPKAGCLIHYRGDIWQLPPYGSAATLMSFKLPERMLAVLGSEPCRKQLGVTVDGPPPGVGRLWERPNSGEPSYLSRCSQAAERVRILNQTFARRYVWIISQLPELRIEVKRGAMQFTFDGGRGVLAAMSDERKSAE